MARGSRYRWSFLTKDGGLREFVAEEHDADYGRDLYEPGARFTVAAVTEEGRREVGAAISLMDAFALTHMIHLRQQA